MKTFKQDGVTYTVHMILDHGVVYQAAYSDRRSRCLYLHGMRKTRKDIIELFADNA